MESNRKPHNKAMTESAQEKKKEIYMKSNSVETCLLNLGTS